jgi:hypothetical protein
MTTRASGKTAKKKAPGKKAKVGAKPVAKDKLDALGIEWLCAQIAEGRTMTAAAKDAGVSIGTLISWVEAVPERSARTREARSYAAKLWDEKALEGIEGADNVFALSKAKEVAHHLRWRASKIAPKEYGDKLAVGGADDLSPLAVEIVRFGSVQ